MIIKLYLFQLFFINHTRQSGFKLCFKTIIILTLLFGFVPDRIIASNNDNCVEGSFDVLEPETSSTIHTSDHFAARWDEEDNVVLTESQIEEGLNALEDMWDLFINEIEFQEPYCDIREKYKVNVYISDEGWASGAGTGERHPAMWLHYNAFQEEGILAHEFTHTLQYATRGMRDSPYVGWFWESHAEWMRHQYFQDEVGCAELSVNFPHIYYGSTRNRYCNWLFWEHIKNEHGYQAINEIWSKSKTPDDHDYTKEDPFTVLARNMNWSVEELNDQFGLWAMHNATWDYTNPDGSDQGKVYREAFGSYSELSGDRYQRVTRMEMLDEEKHRFGVPEAWAPQRWGYNLVRLHPEHGSEDNIVTVSFNGIVQKKPKNTDFGEYTIVPDKIPDPDSNWRWGLVALDADRNPGYSELQKGAQEEINFQVYDDDRQLWLVVVATPTEIHRIMWDQMYFTIYRYPWIVELEGAVPDGYQEEAPASTANGSRHSNGGGWVSSEAEVDESVYVGPHARVLNGRVRDNARIEEHAVVIDGNISDNAVVKALTMVTGGIIISDEARVGTVFMGPGAYERNQHLSGTVQLHGDIELRGHDLRLSSGVFYGMVTEEVAFDPQYGATRSEPPAEVTATPEYATNGSEAEGTQPSEFSLRQNYPNPFNSSTIITYELAESQHVVFKLYDTLGNEITTLVDEYQPAGEHDITLTKRELEKASSGVYFYRIETQNFTDSRSLTYIK